MHGSLDQFWSLFVHTLPIVCGAEDEELTIITTLWTVLSRWTKRENISFFLEKKMYTDTYNIHYIFGVAFVCVYVCAVIIVNIR